MNAIKSKGYAPKLHIDKNSFRLTLALKGTENNFNKCDYKNRIDQ